MIIKNAEPFFFPVNTTGCLLIHGFSASPTEMQPLGDFLAGKRYTVLGIRLAGHGTRMSDLQRMQWQDWYMSVLDGWHLLKSITKKHILIGLSTGGALALYHATLFPVQGVVRIIHSPSTWSGSKTVIVARFSQGNSLFAKRREMTVSRIRNTQPGRWLN